MTISYAILTHNEGQYIETLLSFLTNNKRPQDEIVVVDDFSKDELTIQILDKYKSQITLDYRVFDGDHTQKNYLPHFYLSMMLLPVYLKEH
jgi:glycosyltransferase involved in cell wall biosynthesis